MTLNLTVVQPTHTDFTPRITVIGVGGGGTNAVDNMIAGNLQGVEFVVANTDAQQLMHSRADGRIQLGPHITQGLGAGAKPEIGRAAAEEAADELMRHLDGAHMLFITAGMGGGTGTGAAPVIARMAKERGILTVGVVTRPFDFEGKRRQRAAELGIEELQHYVDTLIVIPNQNLFRMANERTTWREAFKMADQVLYMGVRGVTDLMMAPGLVNLDFADIRTVMASMGKAMMGTGEAEGENRAIRAAESAINNPLLEDTTMSGARGLLINITGGDDLTLYEVDQAANRIREEVDEEAEIIFGSAIDESLQGRIRVSVVATGIEAQAGLAAVAPRLKLVGGEDRMVAPPMARESGPREGVGMPTPAAPSTPATPWRVNGGGEMRPGEPRSSESRTVVALDISTLVEPTTPEPPAPVSNFAAPRAEPGVAPPAEPAAPRQYSGQVAPAPPATAAPAFTPAPVQTEAPASVGARSPSAAPANPLPPAAPPQGANGLFAPAQPRPGVGRSAESSTPRVAGAAEPSRSLFGKVTGALGLSRTPESDAALQAEVAAENDADSQQARATVRQTTPEDMGIGIPKFLLRQSSGVSAPTRER